MTTVHIGEEAMFPCEKCNFVTNREDVLKIHKCRQTEYPCKICHKCFLTPKELSNHSANHKNHSCDECGKTYQKIIDLTKHVVKVHCQEDEKDFKCDLCGQKCSNNYNLKIHKIRKHQIKKIVANKAGYFKLDDGISSEQTQSKQPITCEHCGQTFSRKANCDRHVQRKHLLKPIFTREKVPLPKESLKESTKKKYEQIKVRKFVKQLDNDVENISGSPILRKMIINRITEL
jgi:hypothetical protein